MNFKLKVFPLKNVLKFFFAHVYLNCLIHFNFFLGFELFNEIKHNLDQLLFVDQQSS